MISFTPEELELALDRVERDHNFGRVFVSRTTEWIILSQDRARWLERVSALSGAGTYSPSAPEVADVPKGGGTVRAATLLSLTDEVIYTATVGRCIPAVRAALEWHEKHPDCSYLFRKPSEVEWLSNPFYCWKRFREKSLSMLSPAVNYVVATDVVSFYDCILHKELLSDLMEAGAGAEAAQFLVGTLLKRWGLTNGRGIPQGLSASDILAKLYLNRVDRTLHQKGIQHLRYVDDIRLFCGSQALARRHLLELQVLLRHRGLAVQSSKTNILRADQARTKFDGIQPVLAPLAAKFIASIAAAAGLDAEYLSPAEAAAALKALASPPTDLLRQAYRAYFIDAPDPKFEKTLFHYLLTRLGLARDRFALQHSIELVLDLPQEMGFILRYVENTGAVGETEARLVEILGSEEAVYPYQHYQFLSWRARQALPASEALLVYARQVASDGRSPGYLAGAAMLILARFGTPVDLDAFIPAYGGAGSEAAQLDIVCGVFRMEKTKRNGFLGQVGRDGPMLALAVEAIKSGAYESAVAQL